MEFTRHYLDGLPTILVVAADGRRSELVTALADLDGYEVETVEDGATAPERIDERTCCVVLAQSLSGTTGVALAELIADVHPRVPIVLCPAAVDDSVVRATRTAVDSIVLPDELAVLDATVTDLSDGYLTDRGRELKADAFDTLFAAMDETVFVKNDRAEHLKLDADEPGPSHEEALGKTELELHDSRFDLGEQWYADDQAVLDGDEIVQEVESYTDGDVTFYLEQTRLPWRDGDGEIRGIVGHSRNVSDQVYRREELERKNRRLDQFARYLSHDLQNPLQVADGYLTLAREGNESAFDGLDNALKQMERLIGDIHLLAKGDRDTKGELRDIPLADLVERVWAMVDADDAALELEVPGDAIVNASRRELRPMLENLLKNAVDHAGEAVTVRVGTVDDGIYVADDGSGIPTEERDEIFEQGFTTSESGTGTGLAIVKEVVDGHDWRMEVTEGAEGGARFEIHSCLLVEDPDRSPDVGEGVVLSDSVDVGDPPKAGASSYDPEADRWTVEGGGCDIWGEENEFHYEYTSVAGDVRIEGRVTDVEEVGDYSKAGLMIRESLDEHARHGHVGTTPRFGTEVLWCDTLEEGTTSQHLEEDDDYEWFRLDREGDLFTCFVSADGEEWEPIDQREIPMTEEVYVGLVVCSVVSRTLCTATFEDVCVSRLDADD